MKTESIVFPYFALECLIRTVYRELLLYLSISSPLRTFTPGCSPADAAAEVSVTATAGASADTADVSCAERANAATMHGNKKRQNFFIVVCICHTKIKQLIKIQHLDKREPGDIAFPGSLPSVFLFYSVCNLVLGNEIRISHLRITFICSSITY